MSLENTTIESVMTRDVKTAEENLSIKSIAKIMIDNSIGSVVVVKSEQESSPIGIITERDLVREVALNHQSATVEDIMTRPVVTIEPHSSVKDALQTMQAKDIRRLPVVQKGKMIGIITDKDIFRAITKNQALVTSFLSEKLMADYKPMYERFSDFMQNELLFPNRIQ